MLNRQNSSFKKVYCVLKDGSMLVYQNKDDVIPLDLIFLKGIYVER